MKTKNIASYIATVFLALSVLIFGIYLIVFVGSWARNDYTKSANQRIKDEVLFRASLETKCKNPILTSFNDKFLIAEVDACGVKVNYEYNYATKNMTRISK